MREDLRVAQRVLDQLAHLLLLLLLSLNIPILLAVLVVARRMQAKALGRRHCLRQSLLLSRRVHARCLGLGRK